MVGPTEWCAKGRCIACAFGARMRCAGLHEMQPTAWSVAHSAWHDRNAACSCSKLLARPIPCNCATPYV
eukprot:355925-Chlamydomonas_euryale.AAC.5